jgi:hypothetical protein
MQDEHPRSALCRTINMTIAAVFLLSCWTVCAEEPGICVSTDDAELLTLVNDYRMANGLDAVAWSQSLITVGQ